MCCPADPKQAVPSGCMCRQRSLLSMSCAVFRLHEQPLMLQAPSGETPPRSEKSLRNSASGCMLPLITLHAARMNFTCALTSPCRAAAQLVATAVAAGQPKSALRSVTCDAHVSKILQVGDWRWRGARRVPIIMSRTLTLGMSTAECTWCERACREGMEARRSPGRGG